MNIVVMNVSESLSQQMKIINVETSNEPFKLGLVMLMLPAWNDFAFQHLSCSMLVNLIVTRIQEQHFFKINYDNLMTVILNQSIFSTWLPEYKLLRLKSNPSWDLRPLFKVPHPIRLLWNVGNILFVLEIQTLAIFMFFTMFQ